MSRGPPRRKICGGSEKIHVAVRLRQSDLSSCDPQLLPTPGAPSQLGAFKFDAVYGMNSSSRDVFTGSVLPTVNAWIEGYHGCVFAYGQTSSGKTHTMLGPSGGKGDPASLDGVIPHTVRLVLQRVDEELANLRKLSSDANSFRLQASFVELYNDELRDLLVPQGGVREPLRIREDSKGAVFVSGSTKITITSVAEAMQVVELGTQRRSTGRTNMNEHSSRSHAIFTLHLQHRWKVQAPPDTAAEHHHLHQPLSASSVVKCKDAELHLVDLAGSEYAQKAINMQADNAATQFQESVAINTGLYTLGNVIAALAGHRRVGEHIPYRDSTLTRFLQSALGGDTRTVMIACINAQSNQREESLNTLRYASAAVSIMNRPTLHIGDLQDARSTLDDDIADPDARIDRRTIWIDTSGFGEVFARCIGSAEHELVLLVHGSGPTNSSTWWSGLMWEIYHTSPIPLYLVAIDCPGYGESPGDRQTIRSSLGAFIFNVVRSLGKEYASALIGSSQGAAAVFNALLECPTIAKSVAVMNPVGHDVFRYSAIRQPALLAFDTEDDGHPVKIGRWMRDTLPNPTYFEYAESKQPMWLADNFGREIIKMIYGLKRPTNTKRQHLDAQVSIDGERTLFDPAGSSLVNALRKATSTACQSMVRLAGGIIAWVENRGYGEPQKAIAVGALQPLMTFFYEQYTETERRTLAVSSSSETASNVYRQGGETLTWKMDVDPDSGRVFYTCEETLEVMWTKPIGAKIVAASQSADPPPHPSASATEAKLAAALFEEEVAAALALVVKEAPEARDARERAQVQCDECNGPLWMPRRVRLCRHALCAACFDQTCRFTEACPVCGALSAALLLDSEHQAQLSAAHRPEVQEQCRAAVQNLQAANANVTRVVVEYGNSAVAIGGGPVHTVQAFARVHSVIKGANVGKAVLEASKCLVRVDFDINPDFPKAAIKVPAPGPFILERTMALQFSCNFRLHFSPALRLPVDLIVIPYDVRHELPCTKLRLVLVLPSGDHTKAVEAGRRGKNAKQLTVNHEDGIFIHF